MGPTVQRARRWLPVALCWTLERLLIVGCCFQAAKCGREIATRRDAAIARPSPPARFQGRGELWLNCPTSGTWYSYDGDPREWRESKKSD